MNDHCLILRSRATNLGEAHALLSLAEVERSAGELNASTGGDYRCSTARQEGGNFYLSGRYYYGQANQSRSQGKLTDAVDGI